MRNVNKEKVDLPDGIYNALMSGYKMKIMIPFKQNIEIDTILGVKGIDSKMMISVKNGMVTIFSDSPTESEQELYYIQNGYVGNAVAWWAKESKGYTTDINNAGKYTREEAEGIIQRPQDIAWRCDYIDNNHQARKVIIDSQYLNKANALIGKTK